MFDNLERLFEVFIAHDTVRLYYKKLAANDNSKNQVYFGPDFQALNIFPNQGIEKDDSTKRPKLKAKLSFYWLGNKGELNIAPTAQLILYPQYPEVRFSGFLKGCKKSPGNLMTSRDDGRILFLGVTGDNRIIGFVSERDAPISKAALSLTDKDAVGVFYQVRLGQENQASLFQKFREIHLKNWIDSKRLNSLGQEVECKAPNCGGYTLEAELGITPNSYSMPDYLGYEVKQYGVSNFKKFTAKSPLTLMTPEPTGGYYKDEGVEAFVRKYGYPDTKGRADRMNFGGVFRYGEKAERTKLTLGLLGYNLDSKKIDSVDGEIILTDAKEQIAASWDFISLMEHWSRKHAKAVYVPSMSRTEPKKQYIYGPKIFLGQQTDFLFFLAAIVRKEVYYDPGVKLEKIFSDKPKLKRRSQFRVKVKMLG